MTVITPSLYAFIFHIPRLHKSHMLYCLVNSESTSENMKDEFCSPGKNSFSSRSYPKVGKSLKLCCSCLSDPNVFLPQLLHTMKSNNSKQLICPYRNHSQHLVLNLACAGVLRCPSYSEILYCGFISCTSQVRKLPELLTDLPSSPSTLRLSPASLFLQTEGLKDKG